MMDSGVVKVHELNDAAWNIVERCESLRTQSSEYSKKLSIVHHQLDHQMSCLEQLLLHVRGKLEVFLEDVKLVRDSGESWLNNLDELIIELRNRSVDSNLLLESPDPIPQCLYDFVNEEGVSQLKKRVLTQLQKLKSLETNMAVSMDPMEAQYSSVVETFEQKGMGLSSLQKVLEPGGQLAESILVVRNWADKVKMKHVEVLSLWDDSSTKYGHVMRNDVDDILLPLPETSQVTETVKFCENALEVMKKQMEVIRKFENNFQSATREFGVLNNSVDSVAGMIRDVIVDTENWKNEDMVAFEEVEDLCTWYRFFIAAFEELPHEMDRRRLERQRSEKVIRELQAQLDSLYASESTKRSHFNQFYGRYLPSSLYQEESASYYEVERRGRSHNRPRKDSSSYKRDSNTT